MNYRNGLLFTFHYVSINSAFACCRLSASSGFTFHYVSINSRSPSCHSLTIADLHSTMYLLILVSSMPLVSAVADLHSTMYLLIQRTDTNRSRLQSFTFHYVSINSRNTKLNIFQAFHPYILSTYHIIQLLSYKIFNYIVK